MKGDKVPHPEKTVAAPCIQLGATVKPKALN
jgi:hypothetical protein